MIEPAAPFRLDLTAWALRRRPQNAIDRFDDGVYRRVLPWGEEIAVRQTGALLEVEGSFADAARVRAAVDRMLGLSFDLAPFHALAAELPDIAPLAARLRGLHPARYPTAFEALVNAIACQQISLEVGMHLLNRLAAAHGGAGGSFPGPAELAPLDPDELRPLGFSRAKSQAVVGCARAIDSGQVDLEGMSSLGDDEAVTRLTAMRGVGRWTAEYVLLRGLGRVRVFPGDDVGARNRLRTFLGEAAPLDYAGVARLVGRWHPYAGFVYFHLLVDSLLERGLVRGDDPE